MNPTEFTRGVRGLKLMLRRKMQMTLWSHPSRGAWIEIPVNIPVYEHSAVAPLAGCVD